MGTHFDDRAINQVGVQVPVDVAWAGQGVFDAVHSQYSGRPVAEILPVLRNELRRIGWSPPTMWLREQASRIAAGDRVTIRV